VTLEGGRRLVLLAAVKTVHSLIFFAIQSAIAYLIYTGLKGETTRRTAIAAAVVGGESAIYVGNRFRCPLRELAEGLEAARGSVTDIYLPGWLASNIARINTPLVAWAAYLHARNLVRRARPGAANPQTTPGLSERASYGL
jgi:hypothetical protein